MDWQNNPYVWPLVMTATVTALLAAFAWRRRTVPGAVSLLWLMVGVTTWAMGYALELSVRDQDWQVVWAKIEYLGILSAPFFWLTMVVQYTHRDEWLTRRNLFFPAGIAIALLLLVWTNDAHHLIWIDVKQASMPMGYYILELTHGLGFYLVIAYAYALLFFGMFLLTLTLAKSPALYQRQTLVMLIGAAAPWIGNFMYVSGLNPWPGLDLTPFAFSFTGMMVSLGLFRYRLMDVAPLARDMVIEGMGDVVIVLDGQTRIVDANLSARRVVGVTSRLIGRPAAEALPFWNELARRLNGDGGEASLDVMIGREVFEIHSRPIYDHRQKLLGQLIVLRDVTERRQAEVELRQLQARSMGLLAAIPDMMFEISAEGLFIDYHAAEEDDLVSLPAHFLGKHIQDVMPSEVAQKSLAAMELVQQSGKMQIIEYQLMNRRGELHHYEARISRTALGNFLVIVRNISERKQAEIQLRTARLEAETSNRAKSAFLATMSHELRTPLTVMMGYAEVLQDAALAQNDTQVLERVNKIRQAGEQLLALITDVLDYARMESGAAEVHVEPFMVKELVIEAVMRIRPLAEKNGNHLEVEMLGVGQIVSDRTKVQQVLMNLLDNAAKFTTNGRIQLLARREKYLSREWVVFEVKDTGIGISPERLGDLFIPFLQLDASTTRKYGGTGLGLALSAQLCKLIGGDISVESIPGQGSTFKFRVPVEMQG